MLAGAAGFQCRGIKLAGFAARELRAGLLYASWRQPRFCSKVLLIGVAGTYILGLLVVQCTALAA